MNGVFTVAIALNNSENSRIAKIILNASKKNIGKLIASRGVFNILRNHSFWRVLAVSKFDTRFLDHTLVFVRKECNRLKCTKIIIIISAAYSFEAISIASKLNLEVVEVIEVTS